MSIISKDVFTFVDFIEAIQDAQAGDEINFLIKNDISFLVAVNITKALSINLINDSSGNITLSLTAGGFFRHFTTGLAIVIPNVHMTIGSGIIFDGGDTGGGILVNSQDSSITLNGCTFINCRSALNGGAVQFFGLISRSLLTINPDTLITDCFATYGGGVACIGCEIIMNGGRITGNTAGNAGGGIHISGTATFGSVLTMNGGLIDDNTAIVNDGGGINAQNTIVTITDGEINNNEASVRGGGIHIFTSASFIDRSALIIRGGSINGNSVGSFGGGIGTQGRLGEFVMTGGRINGNNALRPGFSNQGGGIYYEEGAIFEFTGGVVSGNEAASGGGIFLNNSILNMHGNAAVSNNEATGAAGGIYGFSGCTINIFGDARITDNRALCGDNPERQDRGGGGIAVLSFGRSTTATISENAVISGNTSISYGGGIWAYPTFEPATFVNIEGGRIDNNSANFGGGISMGEIPGYLPELLITGGVITNNRADSDGGGIIARSSLISIANCEITSNTAGIDGGGIGIYYEDLPLLTVSNGVVFANNRASRAFDRNPIDDELYFTHIFATNWTVPFPQGYNNYDIQYTNGTLFERPQSVAVTIHATKTLCDACCRETCLCGGDFTFGIFDENGNRLVMAANDTCGRIEFPALTFTQTGVFNYTVREISLPSCGFITDKRVFSITVIVTEDNEGGLDASFFCPNGRLAFVNHLCLPAECRSRFKL